jgi:hypothetical protein
VPPPLELPPVPVLPTLPPELVPMLPPEPEPEPDDWLREPPVALPEVVVDVPVLEREPVETLTSVDSRVVPRRSTDTPVSSRTLLRPGTVVVSSSTVLRPLERVAAFAGLRLVETLRADLLRLTVVRRTWVSGSSETVVRRRVVTLGSSEVVSVRRRTEVPLSRDSVPTPTLTPAPPRPPPEIEPPELEPPEVVELPEVEPPEPEPPEVELPDLSVPVDVEGDVPDVWA